MRFRAVWLVALGPGLALLACSAPDPGQVTFSTRGGENTSGGPGGGTSSGSTSGGVGGGDDGGGGGTGDDGGGGGPPNAFTGAPAFAPGKTGGATDNASHAANFTSNNPGNANDPIGQNCMTCHKAGGVASATFVIGGTVYTTAAATAGVGAGVEVRVRFADGTAMTTYTDKLGNFYMKTTDTGAKPLAANALAGARDGMGDVSTMTQAITGPANAGCNQTGCHNKGGATGVIHVP